MITTAAIRAALEETIRASGIFEQVSTTAQADLSDVLDTLRRHQVSLAIIAPGEDEWIHQTLPDSNMPLHAEVRNRFEILVTARDLEMGQAGVASAVDLKDQLCEALLWQTLGLPELLILPLTAEPMILEADGHRRGREAWRVTIETRQALLPS